MDRRDETTWIAIELSRLGEAKVEEGILEDILRNDLGSSDFPLPPEFQIFIPAVTYTKGKRKFTVQLMEGYAFVATGLPETTYFDLERKPYVNQVMSSLAGPHKMRVLSTIPNKRIEELRKKFQELITSDIELYEVVRVVDGTYRALGGRVLGKDGDYAFVEITLRSLRVIATVPLVFLETVSDEE